MGNKLTIKQIRIGFNETQKEFAKRVGIPLSSYALKEQGKVKWTWDDIVKICRATDIDYSMIQE